jgi:hypothetical protein
LSNGGEVPDCPTTQQSRGQLCHWSKLVALKEDHLAAVDVADMNLVCANGLPGAKHLDAVLCLKKIIVLTGLVDRETQRLMIEFLVRPEKYRYSEAYFRAVVLITVLQCHCGIRYNQAKIAPDAPFCEEDSFIFGIFQGKGGTCATLPVLYASVGRSLGYPIRLVSTWEHLFCRWDDPTTKERFNMEATGPGLSTPADTDYRHGVYERTAPLIEKAGLLQSLSPRRELAGFLKERGLHWRRHGYLRNAANYFAWAAELDGFPMMFELVAYHLDQWSQDLKKRYPPPWPELRIDFESLRTFRSLPQQLEWRITYLNLLDELLCGIKQGRLPGQETRDNGPVVIPATARVRVSEPLTFLDTYDKW